jgi:uncharacterized membrane protein (UPF0127 family)
VNRRRPHPPLLSPVPWPFARSLIPHRLCALVLALAAAGAVACKSSQRVGAGASPAPAANGAVVTLHAEGGRAIPFRVELARTQAEQQQGLMYRPHMDADAGMLFIFNEPAPLTFWMKNTLIPLDMVFIDADRKIVGVVENAEPQTETARRVPGISQYVLEINGGLAAKLGVRAGSSVDFRDVPAPSP